MVQLPHSSSRSVFEEYIEGRNHEPLSYDKMIWFP